MTQQQSDVPEGFYPTTWMTSTLPPVELSMDQRKRLRVLATQLLSNTLRDYDIYTADPRQKRMSQSRWKPIRTKDHITVYKERYPTFSLKASIMDRVSMTFRVNHWTEPKLLVATGWIEGVLDDVMYGVASADAHNMLLKSTVVQNEYMNGAVLACIDGPCTADPFRFLGIKWLVKSPSTAFHGIMRSKDMVFLEATGITTRPNGERIGYQLLHSVDLPQCRNTTTCSGMKVARGHISSCSIFREIPAGLGSRHSKVDVYVKGYVTAQAKMLHSVAFKTASTEFISSWNAVECANLKKLMWCFRQRRDGDQEERHQESTLNQRSQDCNTVSFSSRNYDSVSTSSATNLSCWSQPLSIESSSNCGTCSRRLGKLVSGTSCALCSRATCSRCRVSRTLKEVNTKLCLRQNDVLICKRCVLQVDHLAAVDVARAEVQTGWFSATIDERPTSFANTGITNSAHATSVTQPVGEEHLLSVLPQITDQPVNLCQDNELDNTFQARISKREDVISLNDENRKQSWSRMVEMRMVAESIYKISPESAEAISASSGNQQMHQ